MTINRTQNVGATAPSVTVEDLDAQAAQLSTLGDAEALIASVSVRLDALRDSSRASERKQRKLRNEQRRTGIEKQKRGAMIGLIAGVAGGVAKAVSGVASAASAASAADAAQAGQAATEATTDAAQAAAQAAQQAAEAAARAASLTSSLVDSGNGILQAGLGYAQSRREIEAQEQEQLASVTEEGAQQLDELQDSLERTVDKAMTHLEKINEARVQAQMAATRG